jgi:hypothetical protein
VALVEASTGHDQIIIGARHRMSTTSDRLISGLVDDLHPVRPQPRLRQAFAIVLTCWAALLGVVLWSEKGHVGLDSMLGSRVYLASFLGLLVASFGGTVSALAAGVPGRERLEVGGMILSVVGLLAAAVACVVGISAHGLPATVSPAGADMMCFRTGALSSLLPAGVILSFLVRGWAAHPIRASAIALLASGALGAAIVHASCGFVAPRHLLVSHLSVPIVLALLGMYPLAVVVRKVRR